MKPHKRVLPRDFFNESKLLKCLGQFQLLVTNKQVNGLEFEIDYDGRPFVIEQNPGDATLYCANYKVYLDGDIFELCTVYNSKEAWPMYAHWQGESYELFKENGSFNLNEGWVLR